MNVVALSVFAVAAVVAAPTPPPTPVFPDSYHLVQVSFCASESLYCPPEFVNSTIASHSYYDFSSAHMGALDSNDINVPAVVYAQDKTLITAVNATHLRTQLFYRAVGSAEMGCLFADVAATFPPPNSLVNGTYLGQETFNGALCNVWQGAPGSEVYFTSVTTGQFVGGRTSHVPVTPCLQRPQRLLPAVGRGQQHPSRPSWTTAPSSAQGSPPHTISISGVHAMTTHVNQASGSGVLVRVPSNHALASTHMWLAARVGWCKGLSAWGG